MKNSIKQLKQWLKKKKAFVELTKKSSFIPVFIKKRRIRFISIVVFSQSLNVLDLVERLASFSPFLWGYEQGKGLILVAYDYYPQQNNWYIKLLIFAFDYLPRNNAFYFPYFMTLPEYLKKYWITLNLIEFLSDPLWFILFIGLYSSSIGSISFMVLYSTDQALQAVVDSLPPINVDYIYLDKINDRIQEDKETIEMKTEVFLVQDFFNFDLSHIYLFQVNEKIEQDDVSF